MVLSDTRHEATAIHLFGMIMPKASARDVWR
jgi:hypothetical protein